ncbi:MAG: lipopolysaccharide heptosyltransferase I [Magnetococcales bacterium]|nr:lipopolysaccharide heptosyltransferase I [Magnetococcales bacterium]
MNLLLIKTSSLGDVLHTLPALRDLARARPEIRVHWVVEEAFAQIPTWAENVTEVLPLAWRRWRKHPLNAWRSGEPTTFLTHLRAQPFDAILDAQGLLKSALIALLAHGDRHGLDQASAREPLASIFYHYAHEVSKQQHAVSRLRSLFAQALEYPEPLDPPDFGLNPRHFIHHTPEKPYLVFLHGTTWPSKQWPESHWRTLAEKATSAGLEVVLPWGNSDEQTRAQRIAAVAPDHCRVTPKLTLNELAGELAGSRAVIATDTGPAHLAAALAVPTVALYGPTPTERIGIVGERATRLVGSCPKAPCRRRNCPLHEDPDRCMHAITPDQTWQTVQEIARP